MPRETADDEEHVRQRREGLRLGVELDGRGLHRLGHRSALFRVADQAERYASADDRNTDAGDEFGSAVAISGDGHTLIVSAHQEDGAARGVNGNQADNPASDSGAAYVFTY